MKQRATDESADTTTLSLVEERVHVDTRRVETARVRVHRRVETHDEPVDVLAWREHVAIERVPVNRVVEQPPAVRHEGDTTIVPVLEERIVTIRQLVLVEELHIKTRREQRHERRTVRLRRERVEVDRIAVGGDSDPGVDDAP